MANYSKHHDKSVSMLVKHLVRELSNDSNKDINELKTKLNYSMDIDYKGKTVEEYYKDLVGNSYIYGRRTSREEDAITCISWIITLPKEISDYTKVGKDEIKILNENDEKEFFTGFNEYLGDRYGKENIFKADVHYDEGGQPHMHVYIVPRIKINHDQIHFKTKKTNQTSNKKHENWKEEGGCLINKKGEIVAQKTETGRWEYKVTFVLNENGEQIPVNNYARKSDYYDYKLSAFELLNPIELKHFHPEMVEYYREHNIPGADYINNKVTGGQNFSIKELKEFSRATGKRLDEVREQIQEATQGKTILESFVESQARIKELEQTIENKDLIIESLEQRQAEKNHIMEQADRSDDVKNKNEQIEALRDTVSRQNEELKAASERTDSLQKRLEVAEEKLQIYEEAERARAQAEKTNEETKNLTQPSREQEWGRGSSHSWGERSRDGWGDRTVERNEVY